MQCKNSETLKRSICVRGRYAPMHLDMFSQLVGQDSKITRSTKVRGPNQGVPEMKSVPLFCLVLAATLAARISPCWAQADLTLPGGATGSNVFCLQAGELSSGAFATTFFQTGGSNWEERSGGDTFKLEESSRDALMVELEDPTRSISLQMDFVAKLIREKPSNGKTWSDRNVILNATDKAASGDCVAYAKRRTASSKMPESSKGGTTVQFITIAPSTDFMIDPGTELTATAGPPCPGFPGYFLCPNKFNCAPAGGVCCPGAGACSAGTFCDLFIANNCIVPGNPRFCPGTGNIQTGISLHCPPGKVCIAGNLCN